MVQLLFEICQSSPSPGKHENIPESLAINKTVHFMGFVKSYFFGLNLRIL